MFVRYSKTLLIYESRKVSTAGGSDPIDVGGVKVVR